MALKQVPLASGLHEPKQQLVILGDIYSFGIIMQQIILASGPYEMARDASYAKPKENDSLQNIMEIVFEVRFYNRIDLQGHGP